MAQKKIGRPTLLASVARQRKDIGKRMRIERERSDLSQARLSEILSLQKIDIQRFESGDKEIPARILPDLCAALGTTAAVILDDDRGVITKR